MFAEPAFGQHRLPARPATGDTAAGAPAPTPAPAPALRTVGDLRVWVARDLSRYGIDGVRALPRLARLPQARWQIGLRLAELSVNAGAPAWAPVGALLRWRVQSRAVRLGYTIPVNVCGPGLKLPHWGTIVISGDARVGADATIHPGTCLGVHYGRAPHLGDGVYVGPGAKAYGPITIGTGATLGANSVTNRSVPPGITVGGIPSRPLPPRSGLRPGAGSDAGAGAGDGFPAGTPRPEPGGAPARQDAGSR